MLNQWQTTEAEIISFWEQLGMLHQELPQHVLRGRTELDSRVAMEGSFWGSALEIFFFFFCKIKFMLQTFPLSVQTELIR